MAQNVLYYFAWIIWDIVDLVCVYQVLHVMFNMSKIKPRKRIVAYFAIYIMISCIHPYAVQMGNIWGLVLFIPYYIKAFPIIYECLKGSSKMQVLVDIGMYEIILNFAEQSILSIISSKYPEVASNRYCLIIIYYVLGVFMLIGIIIVKRMRKTKQISLYFSSLSIKTYIFLGVAMFSIMAMESMAFSRNSLTEKMLDFIKVMLVILIVSFICLIIALFSTSKEKGSLQKISDLLTEQIVDMTVYYEQLSKKDEELRRFKHDSKNLLLGLSAMLEAKDIEPAKDYIKSMEDIYQSGSREFDSGNYIADAIMFTKKNIAEQYGVAVDFQGIIPTQKIKDTDLCIFLTNVLDNAIEACQKIEGKRYIHIKSSVIKKVWVIVVSNSISESVKIVNNTIETTKNDKIIHGYGLLNINRVVEKYQGQMKMECVEKEFILKASFVLG